jgi:hypothetical protein
MQQEQQMKQVAMQRQMQARQIYQASLDEKGQLDSDKYLTGLNQSGLSDVAQEFQKDLTDRQEKISHANYMDQYAKVRNQNASIAQMHLQANDGYHGAVLLYQQAPVLAHPESLTPQMVTPQIANAYQVYYENQSKNGFQDQLDTPEQFKANPSIAAAKIAKLTDEAPDKWREAKDTSDMMLKAAQTELAKYRASGAAPTNIKLSQNQQQFDDKQWERAGKALNGLTQSSRTALGVATSSNMRADRALKIVNDPNATPQDIQGLVNTDMAAIMKGGVPDEQLAKSTQYNNLKNSWAQLVEKVTSNPTAANTPGVTNHLKKIILELKDIDNKVIERNAGINKTVFRRIATADPQRWNDLVTSSTHAAAGATETPPEVDPRRALAQKALNDPNASAAHKAAARKILGMGQ